MHALGHGFLLSLGSSFVRRWHLCHLRSPWGVALVARSADGQPMGFLLGTTDRRRHTDWMLSTDRLPLAARGAVGLLLHPTALCRFLRGRGLRYARRLLQTRRPPAAEAGDAATCGPVGVVEAVAVEPARREHGVGAALLEAFEARCAAAGTTDARLITAAQDGAEHFYSRYGWTATSRRRDTDGRAVVELRKVLRTTGEAPSTRAAT